MIGWKTGYLLYSSGEQLCKKCFWPLAPFYSSLIRILFCRPSAKNGSIIATKQNSFECHHYPSRFLWRSLAVVSMLLLPGILLPRHRVMANPGSSWTVGIFFSTLWQGTRHATHSTPTTGSPKESQSSQGAIEMGAGVPGKIKVGRYLDLFAGRKQYINMNIPINTYMSGAMFCRERFTFFLN